MASQKQKLQGYGVLDLVMATVMAAASLWIGIETVLGLLFLLIALFHFGFFLNKLRKLLFPASSFREP